MSETEQPAYQLHTAFPENVLVRDWEDVDALNDDLKGQLWRKRALDPDGLYRSNMAGTWHSNDSLLSTTGEAGKKLHQMFADGFLQWAHTYGMKPDSQAKLRLAAWSMIYSDRGYATAHTHPNCHASGVYYVDDTTADEETTMATGVKLRAGDIEFLPHTPREFQPEGIRLNSPMIMSFKRGRMILFPSNLSHFVHPVRGPGERISIACNCTFIPVKKEE